MWCKPRCISCGTCVRECPQRAKSYRRDLGRARELSLPGVRVAASVAPSFAAVFPAWQRRRLALGLAAAGLRLCGRDGHRRLSRGRGDGRSRRGQTGPDPRLHGLPRRGPLRGTLPPAADRPIWCRSCRPCWPTPATSASHWPDSGEVRVVFIGPCVAKKAEADRPENEGLVDCVLTFGELAEWFRQEKIDLAACEESDFDETPRGAARLFPLEGGSVRTSGWAADLLADAVVTASGYEDICTVLDSIAEGNGPQVVEPLFCMQGCINGPAMPGDRNVFFCRQDVLSYAADAAPAGEEQTPPADLAAHYAIDDRRHRAARSPRSRSARFWR